MKTSNLLKNLMVFIAGALLTSALFIAYNLTDFSFKSKPYTPTYFDISIPFPESINSTLPCGDRLCITTVGHDKGNRLFIVDPQKGRVSAVITFKDRL